MSGGGKGKGGKQETTVEIPEELKAAGINLLNLTPEVAKLSHAPNFGLTTAAFTPQQEAAFAGTQEAAGAFGMPTAEGTGLPKAKKQGGFSGYSTKPLYQSSKKAMDPATRKAFTKFMKNPLKGWTKG